MKARAISRFSSDIAHAVSRGVREGAGAELQAQKTAEWVSTTSTLVNEKVRLAELGELSEEELAALAEPASVGKARIDTPA